MVLDGKSLVPVLEKGSQAKLHTFKFREIKYDYSVFDERYRLILHRNFLRQLIPRLFDTWTDPAETRNLLLLDYAKHRPRFLRMRKAMTEWQRDTRGDPSWRLANLAQE